MPSPRQARGDAAHSIEATVKVEMEMRNMGLRPKRSDSQPERGSMIAVAMM